MYSTGGEGCLVILAKHDRRYDPTYPLAHVAHYLGMHVSTLGTWVRGRYYPKGRGREFWAPLIDLPTTDSSELSFINLVEAHVLLAIRRKHGLRMGNVRPALDYVKERLGVEHPLAADVFQTDGVSLFVEHLDQLVDASRQGQVAIRQVLQEHLERIECDPHGVARKLFPFTRDWSRHRKIIVIDPFVSFGRPTLAGSGVSTSIVAERWNAGDPISTLAKDYELTAGQVEEAIWYEKADRIAA